MTVKAACVKVALPEAFSLPRKFGVSWGCFTQGAFYGLDAVVAEGGAKGVYFRYVLTYNLFAEVLRQVILISAPLATYPKS